MRSLFWPSFRPMLAGLALLGSIAVAINGAQAACYPNNQELPAQQVDAFLANPASLLQSSGPALISRVRDLIASNPATLPVIVGLLQGLSPEQRGVIGPAIGTGAGQAATICIRTDQTFAGQIQQAVATSGVQDAVLAYTTTTGGTQTAAAGGGGAGGGGGLGGPTGSLGGPVGGGNGSAFAIGSFSTPNGPQGPINFGGAGGGLIPPGVTTTALTTSP